MSNLLLSLSMLASLVGGTALKEGLIFKQNHPMRAIGSGSQTLRLLNVEDYIYEHDDADPESAENLTAQFEAYARELGYENVKVEYNTTDTPESMFNQVKLSPDGFDLICPSDYMIQKMLANEMLEKLNIDEDHMPNYVNNASKEIKGRLDQIEAKSLKSGESYYLKDYAVGYMWGTLGIIFDPEYG